MIKWLDREGARRLELAVTMANLKTALKSIRQSEKHYLRNTQVISELRTLTKKYLSLVSGGKKQEANQFLSGLVKRFDMAATQKIIHPNAAARKKSRLMKRLAALK
jgi:small subunit ribosomal protein S20